MVAVVTGASGFVGRAVVGALLAEGHRVRGVDTVRAPSLDGVDIEWARADVRDPASLDDALKDADVVYHLAAVISVTGDPHGQVWEINVDGVRNVAEAALRNGVDRLVHCSSVHAFDLEAAGASVSEVSAPAVGAHCPVYDRSKAAGERALLDIIGRGLNAVIVNPTGVIGPMDHAPSRMGRVIARLANGGMPILVDGAFDWVDVRDVASSMLAASSCGITGERYLLPGHHCTIAGIADIAAGVTGRNRRRWIAPMWLARAGAPIGGVLARRSPDSLSYTAEALHALRYAPEVSGDKSRVVLGHTPRPLGTTIRDTIEWFAINGSEGEATSSGT